LDINRALYQVRRIFIFGLVCVYFMLSDLLSDNVERDMYSRQLPHQSADLLCGKPAVCDDM